MQVNNQNVGQIPKTYTGNCNCCSQPQQTVAPQPQYQQPPVVQQMPACQPQVANVPVQPQYNPQYCAPQYAQYPQQQSIPTASASAVNIQIYNPKVGPENGNGIGCGNPYQQPMTNGCYPPEYYTGQYGPNGVYYPNMPLPTPNQTGLNQSGNTNGANGSGNDANKNNANAVNGNTSSTDDASKNAENGANEAGAVAAGADANNKADVTTGDKGENDKTSDTKTTTEKSDDKKKTEKKKVVELTDTYIKNLENYLDSQEKDIRLNAAKEVYARLEEDESRKDDKALTALINKMLQDPTEEIRLLALSALESKIVTGDDYTAGVLKQMQQSKDGYGQDAIDASKILLQMSGKQVEKEVPVKEKKPEKKETKETTTTTTTETKKEDKKESSKA